ncbi:MAG: NAD-dependent epimerase/dehydratase family protein [Alphaproteobacteria bacterium]|nr:NAD-dependent epimerase/dehydratase family protein [Alphaproteobacteria bacterium]
MAGSSGVCLVTGATGFVGAAVARALLKSGFPVRVLSRPRNDRRNLRGLDVEIAEGSLEDPKSLARAVAGCRLLFHVAADYRLWVPDPAVMYRVNVEGTRDLMLAAMEAGVERIVYTSSVATLGILKGGVADEETPSTVKDMIGPYKRSKFEAEVAVRQLIEQNGLPAVIVNPSTPIGPGDVKPTPTGRLIVEAARGRMPGYVDTGLNVAHVDDVAVGHLLAARTGEIGRRYILGGENLSLGEILSEVARITGRRPPSLRIPHMAVMPFAAGAEGLARLTGREPFATVDAVRMSRKKMYFSSARATAELGYAPRPARQAIADAVAWFKVNGYVK